MTNKVVESSVQKTNNSSASDVIWRLASTYDIIPKWWSPERDAFFRQYWYQENFLSSAIYSIANRNAAFSWRLTGIDKEDDETLAYAQNMLQFADFGAGWQSLITKLSIDILTQDNGGFLEVIRPAKVKIDGKTFKAIKTVGDRGIPEWFAIDGNKRVSLIDKGLSVYDSPLDLPIGIAHLDAGQCRRTGDPDTPVIYTDRDGLKHVLKWWQVLTFSEMPSPIAKMNGVGYSALTRVFRASHIMQSISIFNDEKVSGQFNRAIFLTNAKAETVNDAITQSMQDTGNKGLLRYSQPIVVDTVSPEVAPSVEVINLAEIPDGFDQNDVQNWYIANLALALGVDYGFLAPLPGKGLGTASQSETAARQAKGKSSRLFMDMISNALNFKGVLPKSVQFEFIERDLEAEEQEEKQRKTRADRFALYIENGIITPSIALQMATDAGDIPQIYAEAMGNEDLTPVITIDGDEDLESQQAIEDEVSDIENEKACNCHTHKISKSSKEITKTFLQNLPYEQIKKRKEKLFKKQSLVERFFNVALRTFGKKQAPEFPDNQTQEALTLYEEDLQELFELGNSGSIDKDEFETSLAELVTASLIAFYAASVNKDPSEFDNQDLANIENEITVNLDSVSNLADDVYDGRYQPTEDEPERPLMLITRAVLWLGSAAMLTWLGEIWNTANADRMYLWKLNPVKENCESCIALNGQIHSATAWRDFGVMPQSSQLMCFGKYCGCRFIQMPKGTPENGSLSSVPLR